MLQILIRLQIEDLGTLSVRRVETESPIACGETRSSKRTELLAFEVLVKMSVVHEQAHVYVGRPDCILEGVPEPSGHGLLSITDAW